MATHKNEIERKKKLIDELAASRAEIASDILRLRSELSPKRLVSQAVERHKGAVVGGAVVAGLVLMQLVFRRPRDRYRKDYPIPKYTPRGSPTGSIIFRAVRMLAGYLLPVLLRRALQARENENQQPLSR